MMFDPTQPYCPSHAPAYGLTLPNDYTYTIVGFPREITTWDVTVGSKIRIEVVFTENSQKNSRFYYVDGKTATSGQAATVIAAILSGTPVKDINGTPAGPASNKIYFVELSGDPHHAAQVAMFIAIGYGVDNSGTQAVHTINGATITTSQAVSDWIAARIIFTTEPITDAIYDAYQNSMAYVVCSDAGTAASYFKYPDVTVIVPLGSNLFTLLPSPASIPNAVTTGSSVGDPANNGTGYGPGLEFFDTADTSSSDSNGVVAGKLIYIQEQRAAAMLPADPWSVRYAARITASGGGVWSQYNGYGKINVAAAIAYAGSIPANPYPAT